MKKLAALTLPVLALLLLGVAPVSGQINTGQTKIRLTSDAPGAVSDGNTLVCPSVTILTSSGQQVPCNIKIESTGDIAPGSVEVRASATGLSSTEVAAKKFAINGPGGLIYLGPDSQIVFSPITLPATFAPVVVWGGNPGALDDTDLGVHLIITYTILASSMATAT